MYICIHICIYVYVCWLHRCTLKDSCTILGSCTQPTIFNSIYHLPAHTGAERNLYICIIPACKPIMKSLSMNSRILHCSWSQQMRSMFKTCLFWTIAFDYVQWCTHFTVFRCSKHPKNKIHNTVVGQAQNKMSAKRGSCGPSKSHGFRRILCSQIMTFRLRDVHVFHRRKTFLPAKAWLAQKKCSENRPK